MQTVNASWVAKVKFDVRQLIGCFSQRKVKKILCGAVQVVYLAGTKLQKFSNLKEDKYMLWGNSRKLSNFM